MRNIDSSEWLAEPTLQIVETKSRDAARGAEFTMFANQRKQATPEEEAQQAAAAGKKVASK